MARTCRVLEVVSLWCALAKAMLTSRWWRRRIRVSVYECVRVDRGKPLYGISFSYSGILDRCAHLGVLHIVGRLADHIRILAAETIHILPVEEALSVVS